VSTLFTRLIGTPYGDDVAVEPGIVNGSPGACASVGAASNAESARRSFITACCHFANGAA
jgi:hypothetical protein